MSTRCHEYMNKPYSEWTQEEKNRDWATRSKLPIDAQNRVTLYHATPESNSASIAKNGLNPGSFLTDDIDTALHQASRSGERAEPHHVYEAKVPLGSFHGGTWAQTIEHLHPSNLKRIEEAPTAPSLHQTSSLGEGPTTRNSECVTTNTPWGKADMVTRYARGINFYSTPGHGGFHLSAKMNKRVPVELREQSFAGFGMKGWYEEDCDAYIVICVFSEYFTPEEVESARKALANYLPVSETLRCNRRKASR